MKLKDYLEQKYGEGDDLQEFLAKYRSFRNRVKENEIYPVKEVVADPEAWDLVEILAKYLEKIGKPHVTTGGEQRTWECIISKGILELARMIPKVEPMAKLNFGQAVEALKKGKCVTRKGWNEKGMYLRYNQSHPVDFSLYPKVTGEGFEANTEGTIHRNGQMLSHIVMTISGASKSWGSGYSDYVPWEPSQIDMFAEDWEIFHVKYPCATEQYEVGGNNEKN